MVGTRTGSRVIRMGPIHDCEWSQGSAAASARGAGPRGRGFESRPCVMNPEEDGMFFILHLPSARQIREAMRRMQEIAELERASRVGDDEAFLRGVGLRWPKDGG